MPGPKRTPATPASFLGQLDRQITTAERTLDEQERYVRGLRQAREIVAREVLTHALNGVIGSYDGSFNMAEMGIGNGPTANDFEGCMGMLKAGRSKLTPAQIATIRP